MKGWVVFYLLGSRATLDKIYKDNCSHSLLYGMKIGDSSEEVLGDKFQVRIRRICELLATGSGLFHAH